MNDWLEVCDLDDLPADSGVCVLAAGRQVALFYLPKIGQVYAVANYDPIGQANVLARGMVGDIGGEPMLTSPLYKQHFSLETGRCYEDADIRIAVYPVRVADQRVAIQISDALKP